ncbi:MAG: TPM domain-containing protein, partial [Pseudomonadota bacterium]
MAEPMQHRAYRTVLTAVLALGVWLALLPVFALAQPSFPALSGRVVDEANLLSPAERQALSARLKELEDKSSDQVVVVTVPSLQGYTIEDFGYQLGRHWGIGTKEL